MAIAREQGLEKPVSSQPQYSLLWRRIEDNGVLRVCEENGISQIVRSPLAQGVLTGKYQPGEPPPEGTRAASEAMGSFISGFFRDDVLEAVQRLSADRRAGRPLAGAARARRDPAPAQRRERDHRRLTARAGHRERRRRGGRARRRRPAGDRRGARGRRPVGRRVTRPVTLFTGQWGDLSLDELARLTGEWDLMASSRPARASTSTCSVAHSPTTTTSAASGSGSTATSSAAGAARSRPRSQRTATAARSWWRLSSSLRRRR